MKVLTTKDFKGLIKKDRCSFPKNTKPILNIATQNSQCTRVNVVGSMKDYFTEFRNEKDGKTVEDWEKFYKTKKNGVQAIKAATDKLHAYLMDMPLDHNVFTRELAETYILDLIINKTHYGMSGEYYAVLATAKFFKKEYRFSTAEEETQGIDAWIGEFPVQVKHHGSVEKHHVRNKADVEKTLVITFEPKRDKCYIHNPDFITK